MLPWGLSTSSNIEFQSLGEEQQSYKNTLLGFKGQIRFLFGFPPRQQVWKPGFVKEGTFSKLVARDGERTHSSRNSARGRRRPLPPPPHRARPPASHRPEWGRTERKTCSSEDSGWRPPRPLPSRQPAATSWRSRAKEKRSTDHACDLMGRAFTVQRG